MFPWTKDAVDKYGGFPKRGVTPKSSIYRWIFHDKPSSYWDTPMTMETPFLDNFAPKLKNDGTTNQSIYFPFSIGQITTYFHCPKHALVTVQ